MKKYEHLGKPLSREEQKSIGRGFTQVANTICECANVPYYAPVCGTSCYDVYAQCNIAFDGSANVISYGHCTFAPECW